MHELLVALDIEAEEGDDGGARGEGLVQSWVVIDAQVVLEEEHHWASCLLEVGGSGGGGGFGGGRRA